MARFLSLLALLGSLAAAGWSIATMVPVLETPMPTAPVVAIAEATVSAEPTADDASLSFPAIFGTPYVTKAPEPVETHSAPAVDFALKGVIAVGEARWAILSDDGVDVIVREGETLEGGVEVLKVQAEQIELETPDGPLALGFSSEQSVMTAELRPGETAPDGAGPKGNFIPDGPELVHFQDMSSNQVLAALEQAEENRIARGWVTATE